VAAAIEVRDLRKVYDGGIVAIDGVSLSIASGEVYALLSPALLVALYTVSDFGAVQFVGDDPLTRTIFTAQLDPVRSVAMSLVLVVWPSRSRFPNGPAGGASPSQ